MNLQEQLTASIEADTLGDAVLPLQLVMGVADGGWAVLYFSHIEHWTPLSREERRELLRGYILYEVERSL